jgi:hypothetical protein
VDGEEGMEVYEISFLRKLGFEFEDETRAVSSAPFYFFLTTDSLMDELTRIFGKGFEKYRDQLRESAYASCTMFYFTVGLRHGAITKKEFSEASQVALSVWKRMPQQVIALTLLYEGNYYLKKEILDVYRTAGYERIVNLYLTSKKMENQVKKSGSKGTRLSKGIREERQTITSLYKEFKRLSESAKGSTS